MKTRPQLVRPGDDPISVNYVPVRNERKGAGYYVADQSAILLDCNMSDAAKSFGESHLRFHALMRSSDDCAEADQVAAAHLLPSIRLVESILRECATAIDAASELGVTVQALSSRISGVGEVDAARAAGMWCEVEWPAEGEVQEFQCVVVDIDSQVAARGTQIRMIA